MSSLVGVGFACLDVGFQLGPVWSVLGSGWVRFGLCLVRVGTCLGCVWFGSGSRRFVLGSRWVQFSVLVGSGLGSGLARVGSRFSGPRSSGFNQTRRKARKPLAETGGAQLKKQKNFSAPAPGVWRGFGLRPWGLQRIPRVCGLRQTPLVSCKTYAYCSACREHSWVWFVLVAGVPRPGLGSTRRQIPANPNPGA